MSYYYASLSKTKWTENSPVNSKRVRWESEPSTETELGTGDSLSGTNNPFKPV